MKIRKKRIFFGKNKVFFFGKYSRLKNSQDFGYSSFGGKMEENRIGETNISEKCKESKV